MIIDDFRRISTKCVKLMETLVDENKIQEARETIGLLGTLQHFIQHLEELEKSKAPLNKKRSKVVNIKTAKKKGKAK